MVKYVIPVYVCPHDRRTVRLMMIGIVSLVTQGLGQGMEVVIEFAQEIFELFKYIYGSI